MGKWSVIQHRNYDDFTYGSFDAYVTEEEIVIRGRLKRGQPSLYMIIRRTKE
jgi:hypothetical protein